LSFSSLVENRVLKDGTEDANVNDQVYGYAISAKHYILFFYDGNGNPVIPAMPGGQPCDRPYRGLLSRREIRVAGLIHIGKESNRLDDVEAGAIVDPDEVYTFYPRDDRDAVLAVFGRLSNRERARTVGEHIRMRYQCAAEKQTGSVRMRRKSESADNFMARYRAYNPEFEEWFKWYGVAATVDHKMIGRYRNGQHIRDVWHERLIKWTAAELVAGKLGIDQELINYTGLKSCITPESVLAIWQASRRATAD
jgi:hypothetical protein